MRKLGILCAAILCMVGTVSAQNNTNLSVTTAADGAQMGGTRSSTLNAPWEVGMNFTYQRYDIGTGKANSNLYGIQSSVSRYIGDSMFGIEGTTTVTFGHFTPNDREQLITYAGGLHVGKRTGKIQPWGHVLAGGSHDRFNQTTGPASFNSLAFIGGGGVDWQLRSHFTWRFEADYFTTRFGGVWQQAINAGTGLVINF